MNEQSQKNSLLTRHAEEILLLKPIRMEVWQHIRSVIRGWMGAFYNTRTQDESAVLDRMTLFIKYIQEYPAYTDWLRAHTKREVPKLWQYINMFLFNYNNIETYFILKQKNVAFLPREDDFIAEWMTHSELVRMGEVMAIFYRHHPKGDMEWVYHFARWRHDRKGNSGKVAQNNFLQYVRKFELLNAAVKEYEGKYADRDERDRMGDDPT